MFSLIITINFMIKQLFYFIIILQKGIVLFKFQLFFNKKAYCCLFYLFCIHQHDNIHVVNIKYTTVLNYCIISIKYSMKKNIYTEFIFNNIIGNNSSLHNNGNQQVYFIILII